jgi:hypothetical protein
MNVAVEHSQHGRLLATMMRRMRDAANHDPCAASWLSEKIDFLLPPFRFLCGKRIHTPLAVVGIFLDEAQSRFLARKRRALNVDAEESPEPKILAETLMDHLLAYAAPSPVGGMRPSIHVIIREHAPHTEDLQSLGLIRTDEKIVIHNRTFSRSTYSTIDCSTALSKSRIIS